MTATKILFFSLLFCLALAHAAELCCFSKECPKEEPCEFVDFTPTESEKCRFVLAVNDDCSFKGAATGSADTIEDYIKNLTNPSQKYIGYTTASSKWPSLPLVIISDEPDDSSQWTLDEPSTNNTGCNDEMTKMICTLLLDPGVNLAVNKTMCPDPTTTTMVSTTTVLETTKGRTVFTNEAVSAAPAKNETTSVDETTHSSGTKVEIYTTIIMAVYFYQ